MPAELSAYLLAFTTGWSPWVVLAVARPFGFTILFMPFYWGHAANGMIRMAFAVGLALPALGFSTAAPDIAMLDAPFLVLMVKETAIGMLLGFLASAPLAIAVGAGGIIDMYRGSNLGGADPSGGQSTVVTDLMAVTSLWIFANAGGLWTCSAIIYSSYALWPVTAALPPLAAGAAAALAVIEHIMLGAVLLAAPMLLIMFVSDIAFLASSKFGKNIIVTFMAFSSKALIAAIALPFFMFVALRAFRTHHEWLENVLPLARKVFE
jgi:type III secretory pathway component EscT